MVKLKKEVNMLSGSIIKGLFAIALPIMVMNVLQSLFNIVDMTVLKTYDTDGGYSVGAVGTCGTLITLITGLMIGVSSGANVIVAKNIGKADKDGVNRAIGTSILISLVGGGLLLIIGTVFARSFLTLVNCPERLMDGAILYFRLYFVGVPILMLYNFCAAILRSSGDSSRPMIYLTLGGIAKVLFNLLFVGVFKLQVRGVAYATILSWGISATMALIALLKKDCPVRIRLNYCRFYINELKQILFIGVPAGLQQALYSIANVIIMATVNSFGEDAATGVSIANTFDGILYQISVAPALALMPYVSQNVGAKNLKRAKQAIVRGILLTVSMGGILGAFSAIFSPQLSSIMASNPAVIEYSRQKMVIVSSTYFICGINEIFGAAMRGMSRPLVPTISTLVFMCLIRFFWVYLIFPFVPTLTFLYLIWPIGWVLSITTVLSFLLPALNKLKAKFDSEKEKVLNVSAEES